MYPRILCVGETLWDMLPSGAKPGGAPMNVAIHLKRFGLEPVFLSRVGDDTEGRQLSDFIRNSGLETRYLQVDQKLPTSRVLVKLDKKNNASYEICYPVAWDNIRINESALKSSSFDIMVFGTLAGRDHVSRSTILNLLKNASLKILDVNLRPPFDKHELVESFLSQANFAKMNDEEINQIADWSGVTGCVKELISWITDKYSLRSICVTRGEKGALLFWNGTFYEHPGFSVKVVDTVGAGDAFLAGWIASFTKNLPQETCLEFACAAGAYVASNSGATPYYTPEMVETIIKKIY